MKFYAQYTRTVITQEIFEAETQEEANEIASQRSKELEGSEKDTTCMWDVMPYGRLSLNEEGDSRPKLLLDGNPLNEGQAILIKNGKGDPTPARVVYRPKIGWYLARAEFIGHTYLDIGVNEYSVKKLVVALIEDPT